MATAFLMINWASCWREFSEYQPGKESRLYYQPGTSHNGIEYRNYSSEQTRIGVHAKLDYSLNDNHKLTWYNGYMDMSEAEVRDGEDEKERAVRMRWNHQYIINSTLKANICFCLAERCG